MFEYNLKRHPALSTIPRCSAHRSYINARHQSSALASTHKLPSSTRTELHQHDPPPRLVRPTWTTIVTLQGTAGLRSGDGATSWQNQDV